MSSSFNRQGLVLVAVLWIVVLLVLMVVTVGRNSRLDTKVCFLDVEEFRCKWASRAGVETAIAVLNEDTRDADSLKDLWSENSDDFNDVRLDGCRFRVKVVDEASKLNINTATKEQIAALPNMTDEIADCIIDWRDRADTPGPAGAESGYYEGLRYRYQARNGPFKTVRELLLVKGVTSELLYGSSRGTGDAANLGEKAGNAISSATEETSEIDKGLIFYLTCYSYDKNKDAMGNDRININDASQDRLRQSLNLKNSYAKWIVENRNNRRYESIADLINENSPKTARDSSSSDSNQPEPLDLETFSAIADRITISNNEKTAGRVNINTAPAAVLTALLGGGGESKQLADEIVTYRKGLAGGMTSIADVLKVGSMKIDTFKKIANYITVRSDFFSIYSVAKTDRSGANGSSLQVETVVDRSSGASGRLYWYQGAEN